MEKRKVVEKAKADELKSSGGGSKTGIIFFPSSSITRAASLSFDWKALRGDIRLIYLHFTIGINNNYKAKGVGKHNCMTLIKRFRWDMLGGCCFWKSHASVNFMSFKLLFTLKPAAEACLRRFACKKTKGQPGHWFADALGITDYVIEYISYARKGWTVSRAHPTKITETERDKKSFKRYVVNLNDH